MRNNINSPTEDYFIVSNPSSLLFAGGEFLGTLGNDRQNPILLVSKKHSDGKKTLYSCQAICAENNRNLDGSFEGSLNLVHYTKEAIERFTASYKQAKMVACFGRFILFSLGTE